MKSSAEILCSYKESFHATVVLSQHDILARGIWSSEWLLANLNSIRWDMVGLTHLLKHFQLACELTEAGFMRLLPLCLIAVLKDEQDSLGYGHIDTLVTLISPRGLFETLSGSVNWRKVYDQEGLMKLRALVFETISDPKSQTLLIQNIG